MRKVFIIAEAGVNHNGSFKTAKKMINVAADAGADAVKFQTFCAEELVTKLAPKAAYQVSLMDKRENQLDMIRKLVLPEHTYKQLLEYSRSRGVHFLSSPFDLKSVDFLVRLGIKTFKIPSGEITNLPYLRRIGSLRKSVIISTGMATLVEVRKAINILLEKGTKKDNIVALHCNTAYPTPFKDVNLRAMATMKKRLGVRVGYSDHTLGIEVAIAAVALGAEVIEKHFTLDRGMEGPDHKASLEPLELKNMVKFIRNVESSVGDGIKRPSASELKNKNVIRKSVVAARAIKKGEIFRRDNIAVKRPGTGISPMKWDNILGKSASRNFKKDENIFL